MSPISKDILENIFLNINSDLLENADFFIDLLKEGGVIMICGSLAMQKDVETILDALCLSKQSKSILDFKNNGQLLTDCY